MRSGNGRGVSEERELEGSELGEIGGEEEGDFTSAFLSCERIGF